MGWTRLEARLRPSRLLQSKHGSAVGADAEGNTVLAVNQDEESDPLRDTLLPGSSESVSSRDSLEFRRPTFLRRLARVGESASSNLAAGSWDCTSAPDCPTK